MGTRTRGSIFIVCTLRCNFMAYTYILSRERASVVVIKQLHAVLGIIIPNDEDISNGNAAIGRRNERSYTYSTPC